MDVDRAWICKLGNLSLCRKVLEMQRNMASHGLGVGPRDSSLYITRFQHKIMINPRVLNLKLAFQDNIKLYLSREGDGAYFL